MASPLTIAGFPDVLDPRFRQITDGSYQAVRDMIPVFYSVEVPTQYTERGSALTGMGLFDEFSGLVTWDGPDQGYDWNTTAKEYAKGIQVERLLIEYDQFGVIEKRFELLGESAGDTRQIEAAGVFTNGFALDSAYTHSEGVALFSDSHTSPRADVSTTTGFDNNTTAAFSPTALKAIYIQMRKFRKDNGQPIGAHKATTVVGPVDLEDRALEIFGTMRGLDTAEHNKNVLENRYQYISWERLTDTNNYFVVNLEQMKKNNFWFDKVKPEFTRWEEADRIVAKYRGYYISHRGRADWRFGVGASVS